MEGHFGGYVVKTVNGRILDWCRSQDFMPRHTRAVLKEIQAAAETGARTGAELSAATGLTAEQVRKAQAAEAVRPCSMNDIPDFSSHSGLADASADVESEVAAKAMFSAAVGVFDSLPAETQVVLALRYHGELDFAVIGKEMRTSQARVIELHNEGVTAVHQALLRQAQGEGSGPRRPALPPVHVSSADSCHAGEAAARVKRCPDCGELLPVGAFSNREKGLKVPYCPPCAGARAAAAYRKRVRAARALVRLQRQGSGAFRRSPGMSSRMTDFPPDLRFIDIPIENHC